MAAELADLFSNHLKVNDSDEPYRAITAIGHTRFATSSVNCESELHPHEWEPFHHEWVWKFNPIVGKMEKLYSLVGLHITHNGDFDALASYNNMMVNEEVGWWLERVLHCPNNTSGDSPKIAGCLDLFRVQGRWGPAARLAYIRCLCKNNVDEVTDSSGNIPLTKEAPNIFPDNNYWAAWGAYLESIWNEHINNVITTTMHVVGQPDADSNVERLPNGVGKIEYSYSINKAGLKQLVSVIEENLINVKYERWLEQQQGGNLGIASIHGGSVHGYKNPTTSMDVKVSSESSKQSIKSLSKKDISKSMLNYLDACNWTFGELKAFIYAAVRGFLYADLYNALTEFMSRAEGSFGVQVHSTLEPGVLVISSKGQQLDTTARVYKHGNEYILTTKKLAVS